MIPRGVLQIYRIEAPHFVAGLVPYQGRVRRCAPIIKYMAGWDIAKVYEYCEQKG